MRLCLDRGAIVDETYQLNLGGDTDFQNITVENRLTSKRISKTEAVTSLVPYPLPTRIGPSDYVPFLKNKKICYLSIKTRAFGDRPINISAKLEVEDSPNSAGVVIDLIRAAKIALTAKSRAPSSACPPTRLSIRRCKCLTRGKAVDRGLDSGQTRTLNPPPLNLEGPASIFLKPTITRAWSLKCSLLLLFASLPCALACFCVRNKQTI